MIKVKGDIKKALAELKSDKNNAVAYVFENAQFGNGPLREATVTIKDLLATKTGITQGSSKLLENFAPGYDASIVTKLKKSGAAIVAKTHCDELGLGGTGTFSGYGMIKNVLDENRIIGGSSSGSVATFTSNISLAIGTDTGDSVRLPASYNGFVGFKPSYGAISRFGLFAHASSLDTVGLFAHNINDMIQLAKIAYGYDPKDLTSKDIPKPSPKLLKPQTVAVLKDEKNVLEPKITKKFNRFVSKLVEEGIEVKEVTINIKLLEALEIVYIIIAHSEALSNNLNLTGIPFGQRKEGLDALDVAIKTRKSGFGRMVQRRFVLAAFFIANENQEDIFVRAKKVRTRIKLAFNKVLKKYDVLIFPSTKTAPLLTEKKLQNWHSSYLGFANLMGTPSISIPFSHIDKMPFGLNLDAKLYDDKKLLSYSLYFENLIAKGDFDD